ncbi:MAG: ABC transporter ATP-binding protein [Spirochaetaceae bacterium]|nr:MAG: ABC transporter ATP-binding protein [Spirochaetaceae bacterium]
MIEVVKLSKTYPQPGGGNLPVLRGISLTVQPGESLVITGPSGSGKSTLLNIIGALDRPSSGTVRLDGRNLAGLSEQELSTLRNRRIGFVFQLHHLLPQCSVLENVLLPTLPLQRVSSGESFAERAAVLLGKVGLASRRYHRPGQLSGGECQRVALARALINAPGLVLADEPTGSLDAESAGSLADLLIELNRSEGTTLIVVTHSERLAGRMKRRLRLREGKLYPA